MLLRRAWQERIQRDVQARAKQEKLKKLAMEDGEEREGADEDIPLIEARCSDCEEVTCTHTLRRVVVTGTRPGLHRSSVHVLHAR